MRYSIAVDIGTTTVKSVLFGPGPSVIADASREYRTHHPRPSLAEQNPNDWWHGTIASIRQVLVNTGPGRQCSGHSQALRFHGFRSFAGNPADCERFF